MGIIGDKRLQIWHRLREAREVIKLAGLEALTEMSNIVHQELLGTLDVCGEFPDDIDTHEVLEPDTACRPSRGFLEPDIVGDRDFLRLPGAGDGDRVQGQRTLASEHKTIIRRGIPREDLIGHSFTIERLDKLDRFQCLA